MPIQFKSGSSTHGAAHQLFQEAVAYYIRAIHRHHFLIPDDKHIMLIAIHGLGKLDNYPLARALMRLTFSYLTAHDYLNYLEEARREQRLNDLSELPF